MNFIRPQEPRSNYDEKRLRNAISRPLRQYASSLQLTGNHHHPPPPQWNQSSVNLAAHTYHQPPPPPPPWLYSHPNHSMVQQHNWVSTTNLPMTPALPTYYNENPTPSRSIDERDVIGDKLSEIISQIDEDKYSEFGKEIVISVPQDSPSTHAQSANLQTGGERSLAPYFKPSRITQAPQNRSVNVLAKLSYYSNSRLPASLPPFRVYVSTYPLLCLAALCSANAYQYRQNTIKDEQLISANAHIGTKAMVVKSVTCADEKTIVFAIRGTSVLSLRDWNVNLQTTPESPAGFLDDEGNYCHSGFLRVARAMVKPIAARLRHLLEENPNRLSYSLLITGHSAGGAVASLLFAHMLSEHVKSELTILTDCFKRVHCVTFGAPPITLLPLQKPLRKDRRLQKSLFHSFINEGDPVVRAERNYIMSLVDLLTTTPTSASSLMPAGKTGRASSALASAARPTASALCNASTSMFKITNLGLGGPKRQKQKEKEKHKLQSKPNVQGQVQGPIWAIPPGTLSNAGRLVVLRGPSPSQSQSQLQSQVDLTKEFEEVKAYTITDDEIRKVVFGDPLMHGMDVYRRRIEALAMKAVTGREGFHV